METFLSHVAARSSVIDSTVTTIRQTGRHLSLTFDKAQSIAFVLSANDNLLNLANFDQNVRRSVFSERQLIN